MYLDFLGNIKFAFCKGNDSIAVHLILYVSLVDLITEFPLFEGKSKFEGELKVAREICLKI